MNTAELHAEIHGLRHSLELSRAVIAKLATTVDGVPITPDMRVWRVAIWEWDATVPAAGIDNGGDVVIAVRSADVELDGVGFVYGRDLASTAQAAAEAAEDGR
jgi:hypothetical protein